ncbi:DUF805 domain-containing protein [Azoarcus indigens]|uniref:Uncharacterized membrane protein YhaH (DUF805 family) n=1 Tax=Azoarcus indigens TaxID=29545 RepID=A0A4R6EEI5_9RHOO|nr:DUF805 domain-containing protein [Azoarcus indigens]NMG66261.1 DUF805 domain-containing protein [Azoarcus indigens]TDN56669.1 uncharacterized membrane protein YhaH (DUF805 family) [Azoarcus indigens]
MDSGVNLILTGSILPGHAAADVAQALSRLMGLPEEKILPLLAGKETVVRRNLEATKAPRYLQALRQAGAEARVEASAGQGKQVPGEAASGVAVAAAIAREPVQQAAGAATPPATVLALDEPALEMMNCPSCGAAQPRRNLCRACGVDMPRMLAAQTQAVGTVAAPARSAAAAGPLGPLSRAGKDDSPDGFSTPAAFSLSLEGRVGRLRYLAYSFPAYVPLVAGALLAAVLGQGTAMLAAILIGALLTVWMALRVSVLRLHDLNRSGKWVLLAIALPVVAGLSGAPLGVMASAVFFIVGSLLLLFWPGDMGVNDYGEPSGPNTLWTIIGAMAAIGLGIAGGVSDGNRRLEGMLPGGEEMEMEEGAATAPGSPYYYED